MQSKIESTKVNWRNSNRTRKLAHCFII